jgi:chitodextrinase
MRRQSWGPRYGAALLCSFFVAALLAGPAFAMRVRSPASSLLLAQPHVNCGASPSVALTWTDSASSPTGTYRVISLPAGGKQNAWVAGPWLGNVRSATVTVVNNTKWQYTIEAKTSVTRDSNRVSATIACAPGDTSAPSVPTNLNASAVSCSQVNLSWTGSTDTGGAGVKGYRLYRNDGQITDVAAPSTSTSDLTVASAATYSYQVTAIDNSNNESAKSVADSATTSTCPDVTPPSAPSNLGGSAPSCTTVNLSWSGSTDAGGSGLAGYRVFRDSALLKTVVGTTTTDSVLSGSTHSYQVFAVDGANNVSAGSNSVSVPVPACADTTPPSAPTGITLAAPSCSQMNVSWAAASDASGIKNYDVYRDSVQIGTVTGTSYPDSGLIGGHVYSYQVRARDNASNVSTLSTAASAGAPNCPDVTAPSVPGSPSATAASCSQVNVSWGASTDTGGSGLKGYLLYRNGVALPLQVGTSKSDTGLAAGTGYSYQVSAVDNAGNASAKSAIASATTPACPDVTPPSTPTASATAASCHQVNVSWSAASDTGGSGLNGYTLYRGDGSIVTVTNLTSFSDLNRNPSTQYTYQVDAVDGAGNRSPKSAVATTTTPACPNTPPVANAGADKAATAGVAVSFSGSASSDAEGPIASYAWIFGDGASGSGVTTSHAYASPGQYQVTLTVTDSGGLTASDTALVNVTATAPGAWARNMGSTGSTINYAAASDAAGNVYTIGSFNGSISIGGLTLTSAGASDVFVVKMSPGGTALWAKRYGGTSSDIGYAIAVDGNGRVDIGGVFGASVSFGGSTLTASGNSDMFLAQLDANGNHQWSKNFGGTMDDAINALTADATGNVYITGFFRGTANFGGATLKVPFDSDLDVYVAKFNSAGSHLWSKNFTNDGNERGYAIVLSPGGDVTIGGSFSNTVNFGTGDLTSVNAMTDAFVARFANDGTARWAKQMGAPSGNEAVRGVASDSAGNIYAAGTLNLAADLGTGTVSPALGGSDGFLIKYAASNGAVQWADRSGGPGNDYQYGVAVDAANNVFVGGTFEQTTTFGGSKTLTSAGQGDVYMTKYASTGAMTWARRFGGASSEQLQTISMAGSAPVYVGYFYGTATFDGTTLTAPTTNADGFLGETTP